MGYVVYWCEQLRDGYEEGARVFESLDSALAFLNNARNEWSGRRNHTFRLFELGKELPLAEKKVMEQPPPKVEKVVVSVKKE